MENQQVFDVCFVCVILFSTFRLKVSHIENYIQIISVVNEIEIIFQKKLIT